jgi:ppGpp synthetase/RelA/SpoT-type nucleotidyltranferase
MNYPETFSTESFQRWYNKNVNSNVDLVQEIDQMRRDIASQIASKPKNESIWSQVQRLVSDLKSDVIGKRKSARFDNVPYSTVRNPDELLRNYVKSTESIINKIWRKNKEVYKFPKKLWTIENIKTKMNDIVRFSVKTDSLKTAELFADNIMKKVNTTSQQQFLFEEPSILDARIDNELKMSSGYFAYHCYFRVRGGITIEMQIFSELSNHWRTLSHKIYNELRNNPKDDYKFNDLESRVVSIGHLLYLADCELHNLETELGLRK